MPNYQDFSLYQNILTLCILLTSFATFITIAANNTKEVKMSIAFILWHTIFSIGYYFYTLNSAADAKVYFRNSIMHNDFSLKPGSQIITCITSFFTKGFFEFSYLNITLVYNFIGALGLLFLYKAIHFKMKGLSIYWFLILFIPSMSFWSSGLGKEPFAFLGVCLFLYSIAQNKTNQVLLGLALISMFIVRPHIALMMLVSSVIYFIIRAKVHPVFKLISLPIILGSVVLSLSYVQKYVGLEDGSLETIGAYIDQRQGYNLGGGSSVDIASMSYPMQMFTYVFRPLPFDAHSMVALITSIENTILLLLFLFISFKSKFNLRVLLEDKNLWLFTYAFLTCTVLALTTANLGIATRQKWMFMPVVLYLLIYAYHDYNVKKNREYA
ncbi:hypothetical protein [Psychrobacter sanguinis]|uniref:hypothetical protein n=1 Tax=Psychrobacter sanguinis TaxID=861445 RepID=UPI002A7647FF|nr:hypothetical protein [Psychrobacter sanguinis]MDY3306103.1 hypothetical protein [Psychrobacter sanguinis]